MAKTIRQALLEARNYLHEAGIDGANLDVEVLLAHVLGQDRPYLYAYGDNELTQGELNFFNEMAHKRSQGMPVAYLIGKKEFMGLEFIVDPRVLIPRPETELLIELVIDMAEDILCKSSRELLTLVDVGTGSGAIAVSGAKLLPASRFYAIDISMDALEVAITNAQKFEQEKRITFLRGDLLEPLFIREQEGAIDIILANLPYIPLGELPGLQRDVGCYEPSLALAGGDDGLELYRRLIPQAAYFLRSGGILVMEMGMEQGEAMKKILNYPVWGNTKVIQDYAGRDRVVISQRL